MFSSTCLALLGTFLFQGALGAPAGHPAAQSSQTTVHRKLFHRSSRVGEVPRGPPLQSFDPSPIAPTARVPRAPAPASLFFASGALGGALAALIAGALRRRTTPLPFPVSPVAMYGATGVKERKANISVSQDLLQASQSGPDLYTLMEEQSARLADNPLLITPSPFAPPTAAVTVRRATIRDIPGLACWLNEEFPSHQETETHLRANMMLRLVRRARAHQSARSWRSAAVVGQLIATRPSLTERRRYTILVAEGRLWPEGPTQLLGCCTLTTDPLDIPFGPPQCYLKNLFVCKEARRRGVGRALLRACERLAGRWGFDALWLKVELTNHGAINLYESCAYEERPANPYPFQPPLQWKLMRKGLPRPSPSP